MALFAFGVSRVVWVERGKTEKGDGMKRERVYRLFLKVEGEEGLAQSDTLRRFSSCIVGVCLAVLLFCGCVPFFVAK